MKHFLQQKCYENRYQLHENKNKNKTVRNTNTWRLNNTFLNKQQVSEEIKKKTRKVLPTNDNENTTTQNLWDAAKARFQEGSL